MEVEDSPLDIIERAHQTKKKRSRKEAQLPEDRIIEEDDEEVTEPEFPLNIQMPTVDDDKKRQVLCFQLKDLIINHPHIKGCPKAEIIDQELSLLSTEEMERRLQNMKIEIGVSEPSQAAKGVLGTFGFFLELYFGLRGISQRFINDMELVGCIQAYLPTSFHWLGVPSLAVFKIGSHISDHYNGKPILGLPNPPIPTNHPPPQPQLSTPSPNQDRGGKDPRNTGGVV
jgi:uncharacterized small protein (DUF1192 family)